MMTDPEAVRPWAGRPRPAGANDRNPRRTRIAVEAGDDFGRAAVVGLIAPNPDVQVVPPGQLPSADIVVVVTPFLSGLVLRRLRDLREVCEAPLVLILDSDTDGDWLAAAEVGVVATLWRSEATAQNLTTLIRTVSSGGTQIPAEITGKLLKSITHLHTTVLRPQGLTASGLQARELEAIRLVAEGCETPEIAKRMGYSERTIKNILYAMMARLSLRNRAHAVAFTMRSGVL